MARPEISVIPKVLLQEILLKLPTRDVARCRCVSRIWRSAVRDPTFQNLHVMATHVVSGASEVLLVWERCESENGVDAVIRNVSTGKAMRRVSNPKGYSLANVCNGFLCYAPHDNRAVVVCNPITGEKLELPKATPSLRGGTGGSLFALGFSRCTKEYKVFRLSYFQATTGSNESVVVDVCTLGDIHGWRRHPYLISHSPVDDGSPPVLVDGKLYVLISRANKHKRPDKILEIDVAGETHCTYSLPEHEDPIDDVRVTAFELRGKFCLAINTVHWYNPKLKFWVLQENRNDDGRLHYYWDPQYTFYRNVNLTSGAMHYKHYRDLPRAAWLEDDEMLCYRVGNTLYKYETRGYSAGSNTSFVPWNQLKFQLPATDQSPSAPRSWNVCGGYRPTLLSPLTFAPSQDNGDVELLIHKPAAYSE